MNYKRLTSVLVVTVMASLAVLGVVPGTATPAAANMCSQYSSVKCDPATMAILYESGAASSVLGITGGSTLATAGVVGSAATAVGVTGGVTLGASAIATGGSVLATAAGLGAASWIISQDDTELAVEPGSAPGWLDGANTFVLPGGQPLTFSITSHDAFNVANGTVNFTVTKPSGATSDDGWTSVTLYYMYYTGGGVLTKGASYSNAASTAAWARNQAVTGVSGQVFDHVVVELKNSATTLATLTWYPPGHSSYTPNTGGLIGSMESTYHCQGSSGTDVTYSAVPVSGTGDVPVEIPNFNCGPAEVLVYAIVEWVTTSGTQTVYEYTAPEWVNDIPVQFPNCLSGECTLRLMKKIPAPAEYCGPAATGCPDWWTDPSKADNYECRFGAYPVELGQCSVFRQPGQVMPNTRVDVDPGGKVKVDPPVFSTDPDDFVEIPNPPPPPPPCVGPGCVPVLPDVEAEGACWPSGWGVFNPLAWVYMPVKCALTWAFVPRPEVVQGTVAGAQTALDGHDVLQVVPSVVELPGTVADGWDTSCTGYLGDFAGEFSDEPLGIPCSPAVALGESNASTYASARLLGAAAMGAFTAWAAFRIVRRQFGGRDGGDTG